MKKLVFTFLILLAAIGVGFLIHKDPGFMMVSYDHWLITTSVWIAVASLFVIFFLLYFLIRIVKNIVAIPYVLSRRRKFLNGLKYEKYMSQGILDLSIGNFTRAEKYFSKLANKNNSCANFLLAAQAAHNQTAFNRRDTYLQKASLCGKDAVFVVSLSRAQFYLQSNQTDEALLIFKQLYKQDSKNVIVLNGLKVIYLQAHAWEALKLILPQLKKLKLISSDELKSIG